MCRVARFNLHCLSDHHAKLENGKFWLFPVVQIA